MRMMRLFPKSASRSPAPLLAAVLIAFSAHASERREDAKNSKQDAYCANVAMGAETIRIARQQKLLTEIETEIKARIDALDAREKSLRALLDRIDGFEKKTGETLIAFYSKMKPDAAAAQIAELDVDIAASLLMKLSPKISSAILNEVEPTRGAVLVKRLASYRAPEGKTP